MNEYMIGGGGDLTLKVKEWGDPTGRPILFIHGWSQAHLCWLNQGLAEELQKFRLVAFDLRGHGGSDAPSGESFYCDGDLWGEDVHAVITELDLNKPTLVGWSYGGIVITDYIRKYGDKNVAGINFVCAATQLTESAMGTFIGPGVLDHFEAATSEDESIHTEAMTKFLRGCFNIPIPESQFREALEYNLSVRPDVRLALLNRDIDASPVLRLIDIPILITQGKKDTIVLPAMAESISSNAKKGSISWYGEVGHAPFAEDSKRFNKELEQFVLQCNQA